MGKRERIMYLYEQTGVSVYIDCLLMPNGEMWGRELFNLNYQNEQVEMWLVWFQLQVAQAMMRGMRHLLRSKKKKDVLCRCYFRELDVYELYHDARIRELDVHESVHRDIITKEINKMQLYRLIYYSYSALHISGDVFAHHQEHMTVFTASGSIHSSCCRLVSWMNRN